MFENKKYRSQMITRIRVAILLMESIGRYMIKRNIRYGQILDNCVKKQEQYKK